MHLKYDPESAAEETWQALVSAGVFIEGEFEFASGIKATLKADAESLYAHEVEFNTILGHFAAHPAVQEADALTYVPNGMRDFMNRLGEQLDKPVIQISKKPGGEKYQFEFTSDEDFKRAKSVGTILIGEDVVTTLGSVSAVRDLFSDNQTVSSLAILRRDEINPEYAKYLDDYYLVERFIPTQVEKFRQLYPGAI